MVTLGNEKTQALIKVKDVQKAFNRAQWIKYLEHQIKAAQVNVLDPKTRPISRHEEQSGGFGTSSRKSTVLIGYRWTIGRLEQLDARINQTMFDN
jgi:hypothetical protein